MDFPLDIVLKTHIRCGSKGVDQGRWVYTVKWLKTASTSIGTKRHVYVFIWPCIIIINLIYFGTTFVMFSSLVQTIIDRERMLVQSNEDWQDAMGLHLGFTISPKEAVAFFVFLKS